MVYGRYCGDVGSSVDFNRLRTERREKAKKSLEKYGLDGVICFRPENIRYLTIGPSGTVFRYCMFPRDTHEPYHHEGGMLWESFKGTPGQDFRIGLAAPPDVLPDQAMKQQITKFTAQIKQELKESNILDGKIGLDLPIPAMRMLQDEGINISLDGQKALLEARTTKTRDEIELLRTACAIVEAGFQRIKEVIKPGITERQVYAEVVKSCLEAGAERVHGGMVCSGPHSWPVTCTNTDRIIRPGDIILVDLYDIEYFGMHTCYYRSFSCGKPTKTQNEAWTKARDLLYDALKIMKAGVTTKEVAELWPKAEEFGFPDEDEAYLAQFAHGIGLTMQEPPNISRLWSLDNPQVLEEGMTIAIETLWPTNEKTAQYPNGQALRIEEMVAITATGVDLLSQWPIDRIQECEPL